MRTFFCVAPDHTTAINISKWSELCWPALARRIPLQNYHMTVAFLGETDENALESVAQMMEPFSHSAFDITLNEVSYWASSDVLVIRPSATPEPLQALNKKCRKIANRIGAKGGAKNFEPHLTLARKLQSPPSAALLESEFSFRVSSLELWSSVRKSDGAHYSTLGTWELR